MLRRLFLALLVSASAEAFAASQGGPIPVPLPLFPANNWWNTDVSHAPLDPSSATFIAFINSGPCPPNPYPPCKLHPDWGGDNGDGTTYGFPFIQVDGSQPLKTVIFDNPEESDGVDHNTETSFPFYPIPDEAITTFAWIEGGPPGNVPPDGDRHMLIVDTTHNTLFELYHVYYDSNLPGWTAGSGAFFDMKTNNRRPEGWTSADAAGLAMLPGLARYDEVYGPNEITHAFRVTVRDTNGYVYPASHVAGTNPSALPMGARLRLKADKDISGFTAEVQKIFRAFKTYGLIVADNGTDMYVSGTFDTRWDMDLLNTAFAQLSANDFEVVQRGWAPATSFVLDLPQTMGSGDAASATLTAYDSNYNVATGYRGTVHFMSSDGAASLPVDYTFTAGDAGVHSFPGGFTLQSPGGQTVYATDVADATITASRIVIVGPSTPTGLAATATSTTSIHVAWNPSASGAAHYEIVRQSAGNPYGTPVTTMGTSYDDSPVGAGATYVYKVRAVDASSRPSPFSTPDAATTMFFTEDPLTNSTTIKATHMTEVRQAVNLMRAAAGLAGTNFTDPNLAGVPVKALHISQLRAALTEARNNLGLTAIVYTDPTIDVGSTPIKAVHLQQLRDGVK